MKTKDYNRGLRHGAAVGLGYFAVSFAFGMEAVTKGLSIFQAVLISLTNVTSAGQFSGLGIIAAGGTYIEIALTQLVINLRYCLMSFSLAQNLRAGCKPGRLPEACLPLWHYKRRRPRVGSGDTCRRDIGKYPARLCHQCPGHRHLWNVSRHHYSTSETKQSNFSRCPVCHGSELFILCPPSAQQSLLGLCHHYHDGRRRRHCRMAETNSRRRKQRRRLIWHTTFISISLSWQA